MEKKERKRLRVAEKRKEERREQCARERSARVHARERDNKAVEEEGW